MQERTKLITVVGPTASGKSELAVFLAKQIKKYKWGGYKGAEIISADSRQVFKYLDVGTNKVTPLKRSHPVLDTGSRTKKWIPHQARLAGRQVQDDVVPTYKFIPHHCIDFVHPRRTFTVTDFKKCAQGHF